MIARLTRKVEEVHTTLRNHLAKEEHQLFPLLLQHFSDSEQAELVAHFLCCIPIAAVRPVLAWWKRGMPREDQEALARQVEASIDNALLKQVIFDWLSAAESTTQHSFSALALASQSSSQEPTTPDVECEFVCCRRREWKIFGNGHASCPSKDGGSIEVSFHTTSTNSRSCLLEQDVEDLSSIALNGKPPLREILYFHEAIRSALASFADEVQSLQRSNHKVRIDPSTLNDLAERHRFIRSVCLFHAASEDEIVFPALRRLAAAKALALRKDVDARPSAGQDKHFDHACKHDHLGEFGQFEKLGRLLGDVKACVRRGASEVSELTRDVSEAAEKLSRAMRAHMEEEERDILPLLMTELCAAEQRYLAWRVLCAMPLRLLERVMPWVVAKLRDEDAREWLINIRRAAPPHDAPLVQLLELWANRGFRSAEKGEQSADGAESKRGVDPSLFRNETCGPHIGGSIGVSTHEDHSMDNNTETFDPSNRMDAHLASQDDSGPALKRIRVSSSLSNEGRQKEEDGRRVGGRRTLKGDVTNSSNASRRDKDHNPIDHIFQFHKALRRDMRDLEIAAVDLEALAHNAVSWEAGDAMDMSIRDLQARFQFLRGIYRAHSSAEDEIVFPALEAKETLQNVSHAYSLDHAQEERLFNDLEDVVTSLGRCIDVKKLRQRDLHELQILASKFARMTAAVRAALETHVRAEEKELWPLFAEHFSVEEQEHLVGVIIGRTGAEVLHTMLSWVQRSMTPEERKAMMISLKSASKSTAFEQWLDAAWDDGDTAKDEAGRGRGRGVGGGKGIEAGVDVSGGFGIGGGGREEDANHRHHMPVSTPRERKQDVLAEVARYLAKHGSNHEDSDPAIIAADPTRFRPGWEDIFRMNQKQLEASVRRMSSDPSLDPQHKAYLIQNLMASRYIVAQQKRMHDAALSDSASATPRHDANGGALQSNAASLGAQEARPTALDRTGSSEEACLADDVSKAKVYRRYHNASLNVLGCRHYQRKAILVAPCCGKEFVCRLCHDEECTDHTFDRYRVTEMRCMECGTRQPVNRMCTHCGTLMAKYYCNICHLFDDDSGRDIYHCQFCNFCRRVRERS